MYTHTPVLLQEALKYLDPNQGQNFVDATLGGGGYSLALLECIGPSGRVLSIDLDKKAIENFEILVQSSKFQKNSVVVHGNFADINKFVINNEFNDISGIVADIGLSSYQIDEAARGISFQKNEKLDMRFDESSTGNTAEFILNNFSVAELTKIFRDYSEDKFSQKIAGEIVKSRESSLITHSYELVEIIKNSLPKPVVHKWADNTRRIFQALRIEVNHELSNLHTFLPKAFDILAPGGKLVVVSFHSLEDRIVKNFFQDQSKGCVCPPEFPICQCGKLPQGKVLHSKVITASNQELQQNPRSKSAKLRALLKF